MTPGPIHLVYANRSNVGDWLSARGIRRLAGGSDWVEHLCDQPFAADTLAALAALAPEARVVIGGGGLFHAYFRPFWEGLGAIAPRLRFVVWGVGVCDLKRRRSRLPASLVEPVLRRSRLTVVRDEATRSYLAGLDLPDPVPCPSLAAIDPVDGAGFGLLHAANLTTAGADVYRAMRDCATAFARATGRPCRETDNRIESGSEAGLAQCLSLYARSDLVVSSRLHGCLIAIALGRPVVAVSGDRKIESFLHAAGLGGQVLGQEDVGRLTALLHASTAMPPAARFLEGARAAQQDVARRMLAALA